MEVNINTLSEVQQEADIEISQAELETHFAKAYKRFQPKAQLRGFRKGKVPMVLVKKLYGEAIEHDALDSIAETVYRQAMEEQDIQPVGQPALVDMDFRRGSHLRFKIKYEVRPEITLKKYKRISAEKLVHSVTDEEIEREILQVRRVNSTHSSVDRVTDPDHIVTADVQELDDSGAPLIGKKSAGVKFQLYDESLPEEIKTALKSAEKDGVYRVTMKPRDTNQTQSALLELTVTTVERSELPPLDNTLIQKVTGGKVKSVDDFTNTVRTDLQRYWEDQSSTRLRDALTDEVVRSHDFPVPDSMVNAFLDSFLEDIKSRSPKKTLPRDFDEKKFREENRAYAVWQAKWILLKQRIADAEEITVTEDDITQLAERESGRIGVPKDRLLQYYKSAGAAKERILSDKIINFLEEHATIKEKAFDPRPTHGG